MDLYRYWQAVLDQDAHQMRTFFHEDATICWHNTNECFSVEEFLRANCEYPGRWAGSVERVEQSGDLAVTAVRVYSPGTELSFHVTSFIKIADGKIAAMDEYWGDDGPPPPWRQELRMGRPIWEVLPVQREQLSDCVRLIRESFGTVAEEFGFTQENAPRFTAFATSQERLAAQHEDPNRLMFAYWRQGQLCGYYSLLLQEDGACELNNLCVHPEMRRLGIGRQLLEHAFGVAKQNQREKIEIGIVEENQRLKNWYLGFGFIPTGTEKFNFFPFTCGYMEKSLQ